MCNKKLLGLIMSTLVGIGTALWVLPFWASMDILLDIISGIYEETVMVEGIDQIPFDIQMLAKPFLGCSAILLIITSFLWGMFLYRKFFLTQMPGAQDNLNDG